MANVLILGGGFGGVVAAETLAKTLGHEHQITLVSRSQRFVFYPALVRLAFGKCEPDDISYDLRNAMLDRRISFIEAEVAKVDPFNRTVILAGGDFTGEMAYDYLIFAMGRRLATERVTGFFEYAHHLLTVEAALKFGEAVRGFHSGHALIGYCEGSRLEVPVYETAFALSRMLEEQNERTGARITIVSPGPQTGSLDGAEMSNLLKSELQAQAIEFRPDFPVSKVTAEQIETAAGEKLDYDLLMLVPPFHGAPAVIGMGITDDEGYIKVDRTMRVTGVEHMYCVGDCVKFPGPKMGHMAVRQGEVAASNLVAEVSGHEPNTLYDHETMLVIDEGGRDAIYMHQGLSDGQSTLKHGRFWGWAKRMQEQYWKFEHS